MQINSTRLAPASTVEGHFVFFFLYFNDYVVFLRHSAFSRAKRHSGKRAALRFRLIAFVRVILIVVTIAGPGKAARPAADP